jgi:epoxyqueuosine reductase
MRYLGRHVAGKYNPERILPGCRTILSVALPYYQGRRQGHPEGRRQSPSPTSSERPDEAAGRIARYAWGRDYHKVLGKRLRRVCGSLAESRPDDRFLAVTDATPLGERHYGERAGVGFSGRNTLLINRYYGSWFLLGEVLTTAELVLEPSGEPAVVQQCPRGCRRCIEVCPTAALVEPGRLDASRCISYLTIEHKGFIPQGLRPRTQEWIFGCDLCQEVCPLNAVAEPTRVEDFRRFIAGPSQPLKSLLALRHHQDVVAQFAGSPLMRAGRRGLVRNAALAAANIGARELRPILEALSSDADEVVAEQASWSADRLRP